VEEGYQWVPGFWASTDQEELTYLPTPPPSIDRGPSAPAPDTNSTYVPGCWVYRETRFVWRPGYWTAYRPDWVWMPAHYLWAPSGCLFVEGYWDYPLHERGLLFAPIRLKRRALLREAWSFIPRYVVQSDFLLGALFVRPATCHYYFGDYFQRRYQSRGFVPWVDYRLNKQSYDPNFIYSRHLFANHKQWERPLPRLSTARLQGNIPRPPLTLVQQNKLVKNFTAKRTAKENVRTNVNITNVQNVTVLAPLTKINNTRVTNLASLAGTTTTRVTNAKSFTKVMKLAPVSRQQRTAVRKEAVHIHSAANQRRQAEAKLLSQGGAPVKVTDRPRR